MRRRLGGGIDYQVIFRSQQYSQAQAAGLWPNSSPNRANVAAIAGCLVPCPGESGWSPRMDISHSFGPCAVTLLPSPQTTSSLSQDRPVQSTNKTLNKSSEAGAWALRQPVISVYQTRFPKFPIIYCLSPSHLYKHCFQSAQ